MVHGTDGMDEITITGKSLVWEVDKNGVLPTYEVSPQYFGFKEASPAEIQGGTPEDNAQMLRQVLAGEEQGPKRAVSIMNAAAALVAGNQAADLKEGARLAEEAIDSGRALAKLDELVRLSQSLG